MRRQGDAIDTERRDAVLVSVAEQIIVVSVPDQHPGTAHIFRAAVFQLLLLAAVVLKIGKRDLLPGVDRRVDRIDDVVDLFVFRLDASLGVERPFQFVSFVPARKLRDLSDQLLALCLCVIKKQ